MTEGPGGVLSEAAEKFQKAFDEMVKEVSSRSLPLQKKSFECCVECFKGIGEPSDWKKMATAAFSSAKHESLSPESIAQCVSGCHKKSEAFAETLQREAQALQQSLEKCQGVSREPGNGGSARRFTEGLVAWTSDSRLEIGG